MLPIYIIIKEIKETKKGKRNGYGNGMDGMACYG